MAWLGTVLTNLILGLIDKLVASAMAAIKAYEAAKAARAADKKKSDEAIKEVRKPEDMSKTVEEREKEAESAFDNFRNR